MLYEVITVAAALDAAAFLDAVAEAQALMRRDGIDGQANLVVSAGIWKFLGKNVPGVITSYSIHYTKLYERLRTE